GEGRARIRFHGHLEAARSGLAQLSRDSPEEEVSGFSLTLVSRWPRGAGPAGLYPSAPPVQADPDALQLAHVFRAANAELHQASPPEIPFAVRAPLPVYSSAGARLLAAVRALVRRGQHDLRQARGNR